MKKVQVAIKSAGITLLVLVLVGLLVLSVASIFEPSIVLFEEVVPEQYQYLAEASDIPSGAALAMNIYSTSGEAISVTEEAAISAYNEADAIVIYIGNDSSQFEYVAMWQEAGYNVFQYDWSSYIVGEESYVTATVWAETLSGRMYSANGQNMETQSTAYSIADFFIAEYIAYFNEVDIAGASEIRFIAEGIGGELATKVATELIELAAYDNNYNDILIDRVAYIDTMPAAEESEIIAGVEAMSDRGVAMEMYVNIYEFDTAEYSAIYDMAESMTLVEYKCSWAGAEAELSGQMLRWYSESLSNGLFVDQSISNSGEYTPSAKLASSYLIARKGVIFTMEQNYDEQTGEESFFSIDVALPIIAGFTFYDTNGDGVYNERIGARASNIKIELYTSVSGMTTLLGTYMTDENGFYSINISSIYANRFDNLYVVAYTDSGYGLTKRADDVFMMSNDINSTVNKSDYFIFEHRKNVQIVNVGVVIDEK